MHANFLSVVAGLILAAPLGAQQALPAHEPAATGGRIEVVFCLDTTGSMAGLIEGAKQKIWSVANQIVSANPRPEVRMGLVAYRDRGDEYITSLTPLTADLDAVYSALMGFVAAGGGDGPESVNQALAEAVSEFDWTADPRVLKLIYLVGDAPPHMDYPDDQKYPATCERAAKAGIIINTIQCGSDESATRYWREIARLCEGEYFQVAQDGAVAVIATPFDEELARLGAEIDTTLLAYGAPHQQAAQAARRERNMSIDAAAPASALAERAVYKCAVEGDTLTGTQELVRDLSEGKVQLSDIPAEQLPAELQGKTDAQREEIIKEKGEQRARVLAQIAEIQGKRRTFLEGKAAESAGTPDSFDGKVFQALAKQAARCGIVYR